MPDNLGMHIPELGYTQVIRHKLTFDERQRSMITTLKSLGAPTELAPFPKRPKKIQKRLTQGILIRSQPCL